MPAVGEPLDRVDGRLKVTGRAQYTTDHQVPRVAHGALVMSAIAKGRIARIDARAAQRVRGVLTVMTHENAPRLPRSTEPKESSAPKPRILQLFQDNVVRYANQPIAVVVAETLEAAREGAALVRVTYAA